MEKLKGQTALITGASAGIGQRIAIAMSKEGANVVINYHADEKGAQNTLKQMADGNAGGLIIQADISKEQDVLDMYDKALKHFGAIDILVNNAGIQDDSKLLDMTLEEWQKVINTNLTGQFLCAREAVKTFMKQKEQNRSRAAGKIIFISSVHNIIPWAGHANYAASKGAETMLMKTMAQELGPGKIRVNSIAPGAIKTDINKKVWSDPSRSRN